MERSGGIPFAVALATGLLGFAAGADIAAACTCADRDERDRLEAGEKAIIGRVAAVPPDSVEWNGRPRYTIRVVRSAGVRLRGPVEVRVSFADCGEPPRVVGRATAMFVRRSHSGWVTDGCSITDPGEMRRALRPYARPLGAGRVALLAGGSFGDSRVMALDSRGRVIGYGPGYGEARRISVCPGSLRAAEFVVDGRRTGVAVRDLVTLRVLRFAPLPFDARSIDPYSEALAVRCSDAAGQRVYAGVSDYVRRSRFDRVRLFAIEDSGARRLATLNGSTLAFGTAKAYVGRIDDGVIQVDLATGAARRVTDARFPEFLAESPDGTRLAVYDGSSNRLRMMEPASGRERSVRVRFVGVLEWLDDARLLVRKGGEGRIYDTDLRLVRRYPFFRAYGQAQVGERLYGTDRFRLRSLDLVSGRKQTVAELTDRGISDLAGLPSRPQIEPGGHRPRRPGQARAALRDAIHVDHNYCRQRR